MTSRIAAILVALSFLLALPAQAQQHWLLGQWYGEFPNVDPASRYGAGRTLTVTSVDASGATASGTWASRAGAVPVSLAIAGETVTFTTPGSTGASYKLTRTGNKLEGPWQTIGTSRLSGNITLQKK